MMVTPQLLVTCVCMFLLARAHGLQLERRKKHEVSCEDPLQCYLAHLVVPLPDFEADGISFTEMVLEDITLTGLPSAYIPDTTMHFGVENLGGHVQGHYKHGILSGKMTAELSNANYGVDLMFSKGALDGYELPSGISYVPKTCSVTDLKVAVTLNIGLPHPAVDAVLKTVIKNMLCTTLGDVLAGQVTALLENTVDPALVTVMASQPDPPVPYQSQFVSWSETIIGKVHKMVASLASSELMQCVLSRHPSLEVPFLSHVLDNAVDRITNGTGIITLDFSNFPNAATRFVLPIGNGSLSLLSLSLEGLNSFEDLHLLEPSADSAVSLSTSFKMAELKVNMTMLKTYSHLYNETLHVSIALKDISIGTDMAVLMDSAKFNALHLDQITLPCFLSALESMSLTSLLFDLNVEQIELIEVVGEAGTLEGDLTNLGNTLFSLFTNGFNEFTTDMMKGFVQGPLRELLNGLLEKTISTAKEIAICSSHIDPPSQSIVVWSNSTLLAKVNHLVNEVIGVHGINSFMNCASNNTGILSLVLENVAFRGVTFPAIIFDFVGLNSFSELSILVPVSDYGLHSVVGVGACTENVCGNPFGVKVEIISQQIKSLGHLKRLVGAVQDLSVTDVILAASNAHISTTRPVGTLPTSQNKTIEMTFSNFVLSLSTVTKLDLAKLLNLNLGQLQTRGCEASTLDELNFNDFDVTASYVEVNMDDGDSIKDISEQFNKLFELIHTRGAELLNKLFAKYLKIAPVMCANNGEVPGSTSSSEIDNNTAAQNWVWELGLLLAVSLGVLWMFMRSHAIFQRYAVTETKKTDFIEYVAQGDSSVSISGPQSVINWNNSIVCNKSIPRVVRIIMPVLIVATMGFFLASNLDPNAVKVMATVRIGDFVTPSITVFVFTLSGTVRDMWEAGVYPLSILIAFFSGCWPYVKLCVMLTSWVIPVGYISKECRGWMLRFLDAYGKYSLMDFYVMILMMCSFHFSIYLAGTDVQSKAEIDITVSPGFGFISFLWATLASLLLGHIVLAFHRFDVDPDESKAVSHPNDKESLFNHMFTMSSHLISSLQLQRVDINHVQTADFVVEVDPVKQLETNSRRFGYCMTSRGYRFLTLWYISILSMICASIIVVTFSFNFKGLTGFILGSAAEVKYSIISVGNSIVDSSLDPNAFTTRWMQACFFVFSVITPIACMLVFAFLWLGPKFTLPQLKSLAVLAEILNAWSGLDIFCVSILAALLEIQQFASFIVGTSCDGINTYLQEYLNTALDGDDLCFDVVTALYPACGMLFFAAFLLAITSIPAVSFCESALQDRIKVARASQSNGKKNSIPDNEIYTVIDFDPSKFGSKANQLIKHEDSLTLGLLQDNLMQKQDNVNDSSKQLSKAKTSCDDGCCIGSYRNFTIKLFRLCWNFKLIEVNHIETAELSGREE